MPTPHTINQLLSAASTLLDKTSGTPTMDAELLLSHLLNKPRTYLHAWPNKVLGNEIENQYSSLLKNRQDGQPVAYILGEKEFWSLSLKVNAHTLVPRPETEHLVESALSLIPAKSALKVADLGTGSGAIAIAMASERPHCKFFATDTSQMALEVAKKNSDNLNVTNIVFKQGHWLTPLNGNHFDVITSNPPYLSASDSHLNKLNYEPVGALVSGNTGLEDIEIITKDAYELLTPSGHLLIEHGYDQAEAVSSLFAARGYQNISQIQDLAGITRITQGQRP